LRSSCKPGGSNTRHQPAQNAHPARADYLAWLQASRLQPVQISSNTSVAGSKPIRPDRQLLERSAAAGDIQANIELGIQAFASQQTSVAENYFRRVAQRSAVATANLALLRSRNPSPAEAAKAAPEGSAQAALNMARMYHQGQGVPANYGGFALLPACGATRQCRGTQDDRADFLWALRIHRCL
jgi:TPR repeat protein